MVICTGASAESKEQNVDKWGLRDKGSLHSEQENLASPRHRALSAEQ